MNVRSRRDLILEQLESSEEVSVQSLSQLAGVSEMTIRRDL